VAVNWSVLGQMALAWVVTIPAAALAAERSAAMVNRPAAATQAPEEDNPWPRSRWSVIDW
jgi:hypothetical protein